MVETILLYSRLLFQATHILVTEELPVTAFGFPMPILPEEEFSLPWEK